MASSLALLLITLILANVVDDVRGQCAKVTSYNTGLTSYVAKVRTRLPLIQRAIEENDADVVCLQEVWYEKSVKSLTESLRSTYPYHYSKLHSSVGKLSKRRFSWRSWSWSSLSTDTPCSTSELSYMISGVVSCALRNGCVGGFGESVGSCVVRKCKDTLDSSQISQSCLSCTLFSLSSVSDTLKECANVVGGNRFNGPGLVLLSKRPIWSIRYRSYHPSKKMFVERGYLEAEVDGVGKVVCTHLAAHFDDYMEFGSNFRSYQQQQAAEIRTLGRFRNQDHILMGDLNTGPRISFSFNPPRTIQATYPDNYEKLMSYGYINPYVDKVRLCTYCKDNRLVPAGSSNHIHDYVLLMGNNYRAVVAKRVMTSYRRQTISDHYGVEVRFCRLPG